MKRYINEEKSLKRFLKRKIKITLGFIISFLITGVVSFGTEYTETLTGTEADNQTYQVVKEENESKDGFIYNFTKGDSIKIENSEKNEKGIFLNMIDKNITINNLSSITVKREAFAYGIMIQDTKASIMNYTMTGDLNIEAVVTGGDVTNFCYARGIWIIPRKNEDEVKVEIGKDDTVNITAKILDSKTGARARGIDVTDGNYKIGKGDIEVYSKSSFNDKNAESYDSKAKTEAIGIFFRDGCLEKGEGKIIVTAESETNTSAHGIILNDSGKDDNGKIMGDGDIIASSSGKESANSSGIYSWGTIQKGNGKIEVKSTGTGSLGAYGIKALSKNKNIEVGVVDIFTNISGNKDTADTNITSESIGVYADGGKVNIAGGTIVSSAENVKDNAVVYAVRNKAEVNINQGTSNDVNIYGDISNDISGTINLNMNTKNSAFTGLVDNAGTVNLNLENGAVWNNKKAYYNNIIPESKITNLTLKGGIINNKSVESNITVENLKGTGGTFNMKADIDETTGKAVSGKLTFENITEKNAKFGINYKGDREIDNSKVEQYFDDLVEKITVNSGDFRAEAKFTEGFISPEYTAIFVRDETGNIVVDRIIGDEPVVKPGNLNSMVQGMKDLATINLLTWRQEMNSLNKRMGELRNSTGEQGVWARVYTGKIENGSQYDNEYQSYQVGYDKKYSVDNGTVFVGALVSYTDGETNYKLGSGENYSVGAGIYATWLNNDGQFADVILKQSRLHNKFDVTSKDGDKSQHGDYNNWGTSLSGQYGKRFDLNEKFFVEPSAELTLGRVDAVDYTTSADVKVHQDSMYSLIGNIGTAVGYKFSDKGNVYARASLVKEFQGDIDTKFSKGDEKIPTVSEDLSDTWAEFGIGVNYRFVENMNVYVDIQKTGEAEVDNKWQGNLGFRYEF